MAEILELILPLAFLALLLYVAIRLLIGPLKGLVKLAGHVALGLLLLVAANLVGGFFNVMIPITPLRLVIAGIAGVPGVILIILYTILF
ncbi:MAG: pro-sigmaK processing inhibitor BofA family protein [Oscillospiraceae bacterium]|nr:pro-sigmaK processing inhibitor BofA family protein [Oscillospiraceae bacterium]